MENPIQEKVIPLDEIRKYNKERLNTNKLADYDHFISMLRYHTNEIKELVVENGKLLNENKRMNEHIKKLESELSKEKEKNTIINMKKYFGIILGFILIFQVIATLY